MSIWERKEGTFNKDTFAARLVKATEKLAAEEHRRVELLQESVSQQAQQMEQNEQHHREWKDGLDATLARTQHSDPLPRRDLVLTDIRDERIRQVAEEEWDESHDDQHVNGELASAAAAFAIPLGSLSDVPTAGGFDLWPWESHAWKKGEHPRRRQLVIAGALITAEIERLDRIDERLKAGVCPFEEVPEIPCNETCPKRGRCKVGEREP